MHSICQTRMDRSRPGTPVAIAAPVPGGKPEPRVGRADGPGSGRFLSLALVDALEDGSDLAAVRFHLVPPAVGQWSFGVAFAFQHEFSSEGEVVLAGVDAAGHVVAAELLRSGREPARRYRRQLALANALRGGHAVESIQLQTGGSGEPRSVTLVMENPEWFVLDLSDFDRIPPAA